MTSQHKLSTLIRELKLHVTQLCIVVQDFAYCLFLHQNIYKPSTTCGRLKTSLQSGATSKVVTASGSVDSSYVATLLWYLVSSTLFVKGLN